MGLYDVEQNIVGRAQRRNNVPEGGFDGTGDFAAWIEQELQRNPGYQMPQGYSQGEDGAVSRDKNWLTQNPWVFPLAGIGGGLIGGAATGSGFFAPSAAPAAGGLSEAVIPTTAGASAGGGLPSWLGPVLAAGTGLAGRAMTGGGGGNNQIPIPPELQQLLTEATRRTMNQAPLSDAINQQALASLPNYARR
jgi:hypothetical protein